MSQGMNKNSSDKHYLSKDTRRTSEIISQLDDRLDRLRQSILPKQPYLVSVPSDVPYRHSSRFVNTWYEGTPFDRDEEQLQYISFLSRQREEESLLKVEGSWADDQGSRIDEDTLSPKTIPITGQHTPADRGHRKKISLKDYKTNRRASPESASQPPDTTSPKKPIPEPAEQRPAAAIVPESAAENGAPHPVQHHKEPRSQESGRGAVFTDGHHSSPPRTQTHKPTSSPTPAKRRKLSGTPEEREAATMSTKVEAQSTVMKMPRLLSPTLPSPQKQIGLPELLSPLLPPSLAKAISTPSDTISIGSPAAGSHSRTDSVRAILASADLDDSPTSKGGIVAGDRARSDSQHSARDSFPGTPNTTKPVLGVKPLSKIGTKLGTPLQQGARASPGPRQRHTIILKYGKKNRKRVEALLKLGPRAKKTIVKNEDSAIRIIPDVKPKKELARHETNEAVHAADSKPKNDTMPDESREGRREKDAQSKSAAPDNSKPEKKRKLEISTPLGRKRLKPSAESDKRPSTPVQLAGKAPTASQSKSTFSTPKKELKSTAMRRVESSDYQDVPTPTGGRGRVSTPVAVPKPSPQPPTATSSREEERHLWTNMNTKFFALGRSLKHEGTKIGPSANGEVKGYSGKSVALLTEALICFMINISAQAHARPGVDPGWTSIIPYHIFLWRASRKHVHLHGLVVQLGAVCRQLIHKCDMDRLARDPLPDDYCNSAPTPGSDGNTKTNEDAEKYKKSYIEFKDNLIQNARELQTAWLEGSRQLSPDILKRDYPNTFSKRAKDSSVRMQEKPTPSKVPKEFYLPLDANTTAFEAARFGLAFLQEWAEKENVEWKTSVEL
ncbi:uncharacterized protein A1O9_09042 [Exophiala aquamarina CBS 119918]|uniref:Uncharacterized protein n=1 Tax=Exophiala aquamarina CBS 119918 TaxID=1182545 RepID=A0A072PGB0_9EURO|nr:uncharacterized protein A1O9_09042 [Exophiala aquamarina CBS 119918]KEF54600.1 hypothetical protein A1O9_09042 [Exophiala aquamarina CBS 119918]